MEKIQEYLELALDKVVFYTPKVILAALIFWLGLKIIAKIINFVKKVLERYGFTNNITPFLISLTNISLKVGLTLIVASILGADLTGFIAVLAAAGFAIGMALQGSLGNFASGVLILGFKPYKSGDWIQLEEYIGKVEEVGIFNTKISTIENNTLIIPNSKVTESILTNYSDKGTIRLAVMIPVPYSESFPRVENLLRESLKNINEILEDPKPVIEIDNFDTHNIVIAVRPYAEPDSYWVALRKTRATIKKVFHDNNIQIAYVEGYELGEIGE
ncbi:MAG: mechanosensitive ion channel family protein [Bacteroidota bacterium]